MLVKTANQQINIDEFSTLGLDPAWEKSFGWASKNGIGLELLHVINATWLWDHPLGLKIIFSVIMPEHNRSLLSAWAKCDGPAATLNRIAKIAVSDPSIEPYEPPSTARSVTAQFKGLLPTHYLAACLLQPIRERDQTKIEWFCKFKLWLLCHALYHEMGKHNWGSNLHDVCKEFRLACKDGGARLDPFLELANNARNLDEFDRQVLNKIDNILEAIESRVSSETKERFIGHSNILMLVKSLAGYSGPTLPVILADR